MDPVELLSSTAPGRADAIRRRYWRDAGFRGVCDDFRDARQALERLEAAEALATAEIEQYRELVAELLAEALGMLGDER